MIWEGTHVHTGYICRYSKRRKKTPVGWMRILHRTASPYCELMQSFWQRDAISLHILTHDQMLIHLAKLSGHHPVFGFSPLLSFLLPDPIPAPNNPQDSWCQLCLSRHTLIVKKYLSETTISATLDQITSALWDVSTAKPEEPIRSLWSYLTGLKS